MMNVVASFRITEQFEHAIAELEMIGIESDAILALPLETKIERELLPEKQRMLFESAPIVGMILMLLGTIYGYVLKWGPIIWAIIGLVIGMGIGFFIDYLRVKQKERKGSIRDRATTEVFLLIYCENKAQANIVKEKLWQHSPNGITMYGVASKETSKNDYFTEL
ncbi:hypothetical protein [Bacillus marasmi]|uniref:hypothetical protein n=1 Tax=Bacillus marasmi TaxID=1926279 RepID=UPI0011CB5398|nr:hypothetical protein [Bacillus marasmi]